MNRGADMTCKRFKDCVCVSNTQCLTNNNNDCLMFKNNTRVLSCSENRKKYYLENCGGRVVAKYHIDNGVIEGQNSSKCDYMFVGYQDDQCQKDIVIFVELKGCKINHAYEQLEETIKSLVSANRFPNKVKVYARIVSSSTPPKTKNPIQQENLFNLLGSVNGEKNGSKYFVKGTMELHDDFSKMAK